MQNIENDTIGNEKLSCIFFPCFLHFTFLHFYISTQEITDKIIQNSNLSESPCLSDVYEMYMY